jgi:hypothetical protein
VTHTRLFRYDKELFPLIALGCVCINLPALLYVLWNAWSSSELYWGLAIVLGWGLLAMICVADLISKEVGGLERKRLFSILPEHVREEVARAWREDTRDTSEGGSGGFDAK